MPKVSGFKERLKKMQKRWDDGKEQAKAMFDKIPEGEHIGKLAACQITEAKSSGKLLVRRQHVVTEGDSKGANAFDNLNIETDYGFAFLCQWLETVGASIPDDAEDLEKIIKKLNDNGYRCTFKVKHSDDFVNVRVLEKLDDDGSKQESGGEEGGGSESGTQVELDNLDRKELVALIEEYDLDVAVSPKMKEDVIRKAIREAVSGTEASGEEGGGGNDADDELLIKTKAFCEACDIDYEDEEGLSILKKKISKFRIEESQLDEDDVALLTKLELAEKVIEKPKPTTVKKKKISLKK